MKTQQGKAAVFGGVQQPKYLIAKQVQAMLAALGVVGVRREFRGEMVPGTIPTAPFGMVPMEAQLQQAVSTAAGTIISISATTPDTFDSAGYQSTDLVWSAIGEVTDGGSHGRTYAEITHKPIGTRGVRKYKGSFDIGQKTIQMALDMDDAGQDICRTAALSDNDYSFKVAYPNGDIDYFQAKVMSFTKSVTNVDSIISATMQLSLTASNAGVGVVEYEAP